MSPATDTPEQLWATYASGQPPSQ